LAQEVIEWVLHPRKFDHAECGGVISMNPVTLSAKEFISATPNIGTKNRNLVMQVVMRNIFANFCRMESFNEG